MENGHNAAAAAPNINAAFLEDFAKDRTIRHWFERFWSDESLEDEDRGGPPSLQLKDTVGGDPRQTVREPAQHFGVDDSTVAT
ncbi:unnamed protein product [Heligmosomoides polygyrus]|uniref:HTH_48 domain-containing protein n=1 Tax=Heligmosomoides polygyrus TaxID=6339 RepID=A0A183GD56_HELPZ|nr:unnamed protein product [Heligmosomoides polygyrus]